MSAAKKSKKCNAIADLYVNIYINIYQLIYARVYEFFEKNMAATRFNIHHQWSFNAINQAYDTFQTRMPQPKR